MENLIVTIKHLGDQIDIIRTWGPKLHKYNTWQTKRANKQKKLLKLRKSHTFNGGINDKIKLKDSLVTT